MQRNHLRKGDRGAIRHAGDNAGQFGSPISAPAPGGIKALQAGPGSPANASQAGFWARNPSLDPAVVTEVANRLAGITDERLDEEFAAIKEKHHLDNVELTDIHRSFGPAPGLNNSYPPGVRADTQDAFESLGIMDARIRARDELNHFKVELPGNVSVPARFDAAGEMSVKSGAAWLRPGVAWSRQELWDDAVAAEVDGQATTQGFADAPNTGVLYGSFDRHSGGAYFAWEDVKHRVAFSAKAGGVVDFGDVSTKDRRAMLNAFSRNPDDLKEVLPTVKRIKDQASAARELMVNHPATSALRRRHQG